MSSVSAYGLVNAQARAKRSRLLDAEAYKALVAAPDLPETINLLARFKYLTEPEKIRDLAIESLEKLLIQIEVKHTLTLLESSRGPARQIMGILLNRIDAENVKTVLRAWHKREKSTISIIVSPGLAVLPVATMLSAPSLPEFARPFSNLPFYQAFLKAAAGYERQKSLFELEVAIDKSLYEAIFKLSGELPQADQQLVRRMVGIEIDLKNLDWVARIRKYYLAQARLTEHSLIPHGYRLPYSTLQKMLATGTLEEGLEKIMPGLTPTATTESDRLTSLERLEQFLNQALFYEANRLFLQYPLSIASTIGYYYLVRIESRNIRTIINAKYYRLPSQTVLAKLVY